MKANSLLVALSLGIITIATPAAPANAALITAEFVFNVNCQGVSNPACVPGLPISDGLLRIVQTLRDGDVSVVVPIAEIAFPTFEIDETFTFQRMILTDSPLLLTLQAIADGKPAFGYPADTLTPDAQPDEPPIVIVGDIPEEAPPGSQLTALGPIFSFASPGTHVSNYQITVTSVATVPEPATLALLGAGMSLLASRRLRRRRQPGRVGKSEALPTASI